MALNILIELLINSLFISAIFYLYVGLSFIIKKNIDCCYSFSFILFSSAVYSLFYFFQIKSTSQYMANIFLLLEYIGIVFIPTFGIFFSIEYTKILKLNKKIIIALFSLSLFFLISVFTNSYHFLFHQKIEFSILNNYAILTNTKGIIYYLLLLYYCFFIILSNVLFFMAYKRADCHQKGKYFILFLNYLIPYISIFVILFGYDKIIDPVPLTITVMNLIFLYNAYQNDMFEQNKKIWLKVFDEITECAFIFDLKNNIIDKNFLAKEYFGNDINEVAKAIQDNDKKSIMLKTTKGEMWFIIHQTLIISKHNNTKIKIAVLEDITNEIQNENNYKAFINTIDDLVFIASKKGEILYTNSAVTIKLGYSEKEIKKMHILDFHPKKLKAEAEKIFADMLEGKSEFCYLPLQIKNGGQLAVETRIWFGKWDMQDVIYGVSKDLSLIHQTLDKFQKAFDNNPSLMAISNSNTNEFIQINEAFLNTLGYKENEVIGKTARSLNMFVDEKQVEKAFSLLSKNNKFRNIEVDVKAKNGAMLTGLFSGEYINNFGEKLLITIMTDITDRKNMEKQLKINEKMLNAIAIATKELLFNKNYYETIPIGLKLLGEATGVDRVYYFQNSYENGKGYSSQKFEWCAEGATEQIDNPNLQNTPFELLEGFIEPLMEGKPFISLISDMKDTTAKDILKSQDILSIVAFPIIINNSFWGFVGFDECKFERIWSDAEKSLLLSFAASISKAIEIKTTDEKVLHLSYHDSLTNLYNRRMFEESLISNDKKGLFPISVMLGDVNGLKLINDAFGHICGDNILIKIAKIMEKECGKNAFVARLGGDEFAAFIPNTSYDEAYNIVQNIKKSCEMEQTDQIILNISFGVATKTNDEQSLQDLLNIAEDRMYTSKLLEGKSIRSKIIDSLIAVLEEKTGETKKHCERIAKKAEIIANHLGMTSYEIENIRLLAMLHDIGKTGIPDNILLKPDYLNKNEKIIMKKHCEIGFRIANTTPELVPISECILCHHERWDGGGYPRGIGGDKIPLMSRIISVLDAYDAMTNDRPYRKAMSKKEAIKELIENSNTQFDPSIVEIFIKLFGTDEIID